MSVPKHIAVIIDGNRRYAEMTHISVQRGHEIGAKRLYTFISWCHEAGIKEVTAYCLSIKNFKREKEEITHLVDLIKYHLTRLDSLIEHQVRLKVIGNKSLLDEDLKYLIRKAEEKTKGFKKMKLNLAIAYDGRDEILRAINSIKKRPITEDDLTKALDLQSSPDLIIRTSERRLSGFLLWQSTYSEIIFLEDIYWPILQKKDFDKILNDYSDRRRRYGK